MLRTGLRVFFAALFFTAGIALLSMSLFDQWAWFTAALGVIALGKAMLWIGLALGIRSTERRGRLWFATGFRGMAVSNIVAGALAVIGALRSLEHGFALIVAFGAVCWSWGWAWFFLRARRWFQASGAPARPMAVTPASDVAARHRPGSCSTTR